MIRPHFSQIFAALAAAGIVGGALVACGGGSDSVGSAGGSGGSGGIAVTTQSLTGVAATGAPMAGAAIKVKDASGAAIATIADANGNYSANVQSLTAPLIIIATSQQGDTILTLTSIVVEKPAAGATGIANITPLTHAISSLIAPNGNPEALTGATLTSSANAAAINNAVAKLNAALADILVQAGLNASTFNPITTRFVADRTGADRVLELVRVEQTGQGVAITSNAVADDGAGSASVNITATGQAPAALPAPPAGTLLGELDHFASLADTCFADAPSVRVTALDAAGNPTTLSAACAAVPFTVNYKSGGFTARQRYGGLLRSPDFTGAKFAKPERVFTTQTGTVFFKMPYKTASGAGNIITDIAEKTNPTGKSYAWEINGNQRDYDSAVDARLDNTTQLNPNNVQEVSKSQYGVSLRLFFNPATTAGQLVQLARVKGPGLPPEGVMLTRSNVCGVNDYMTIYSKSGQIRNVGSLPILYTSSSSNNFRLSAALKTGAIDWSKVTNFSNWSTAPLTDNQLAAIPNFAAYTWDLWLMQRNTSGNLVYRADLDTNTVPDVTYRQQVTSRAPAIGSLATLPWNTLNANPFLDPTSASATVQSSVQVGWTATDTPVDSVTVFGQKNTAAFATNAASSIRVSGDTSRTGVEINATTSTVSPAGDASGTETLRGITGVALPAAAIPNCTTASFPAFDAVAGTADVNGQYATFRSITIRNKAPSLARKYVTQSWSNFTQ